MAEETAAGTASPAAEAPQATAAQAPDSSQPTTDPGDYEAKIRSDPEFALAEVKRQQAAASRFADQAKRGKLALQIAEQLGNGDVEKGAEIALRELHQYRQVQQDPKLAPIVQRRLAGDPLNDLTPEVGSDDPYQRELSELRGTVTRLQTDQYRMRLDRQFQEFQSSKLGAALSPEQKQQVYGAIERQFGTWSTTPQGRETLSNLNAETLRLIAVQALGDEGLLEVGERAARAKAEQLRERGTEVPSSIQGNRGTVAPALPANVTALQALRAAKAREGVA